MKLFAQENIRILVLLLFAFILIEFLLTIYFRIDTGIWIYNLSKNSNSEMFERHPYTIVRNRKKVEATKNGVRIQHNELGYRNGSTNELMSKFHIVALGGSTTYGVGVNNEDTWPALLNDLIIGDSAVFNLGTPGHSSVENLITATLYLDVLQPDVILLHVGLNDMRMSNTRPLLNDYSNFHIPSLIGSMGLCYLEEVPHVATAFYTIRMLQSINWVPTCEFHSGQISGNGNYGLDTEALKVYETNLGKLIYQCKYYTKNVIIIPQILVQECIENNSYNWWIPFVEEYSILEVLSEYNMVSKKLADKYDCIYLESVDQAIWNKKDFTDPSHFNENGNRKLAEMIYRQLSISETHN